MQEETYEITKQALVQELWRVKKAQENLKKQWRKQTFRLILVFAFIGIIYAAILFCGEMAPLLNVPGWVLTFFLLFIYPLFVVYKVFVYMGDMGFPWCAKLFCGGRENSYPSLKKEYQEKCEELAAKLKQLSDKRIMD
ncbi:MAG: hypothetical protein J6I65_04485 [Lachnospiraceae bacterium]|nr:hypothetical protein [Lachnospiraceae bacterium]